MEKYLLVGSIGSGTSGVVGRAIDRQSGEVVAIKKMRQKFNSWEECLNLREVKSLQTLNHPNIVLLKELIRENCILYFVLEYMECNLYELITSRKHPLSEDQVRNFCFQVFQGLAYMNRQGYFHRDLKPENLLVSKDVIKIADLGSVREIGSKPPYTDYVSTRWYRAPELLLQSQTYTSKVDMWAMGAVMAELFTLRPLFPGTSEADQMYKICSVLGSPTMDSWADGIKSARAIKYQFPQFSGVHLSSLMPNASPEAVHLISLLCSWNPSKRPSASLALTHPFFRSCFYVQPSISGWSYNDVAERKGQISARTWASPLQEQDGWSYDGGLFNWQPNDKFMPHKVHSVGSVQNAGV